MSKPAGRTKKCAKTGKTRFHDEGGARRALGSIRARAEPDTKIPTRVYRCPDCGGWHLSSAPSISHEYDAGRTAAPPPEDLTPLEASERDVESLRRVVETCIAEGCQTCMRHPEWGLFRIRRGMAS